VEHRRLAYVALAFAALLFGVTFVVIKDAIAILPPFAFVGWRFLLGAVVLFVVARPQARSIWRDGLIAGLFLYLGYATQTLGLESTTASNSALITGLYVVFTPLLAAAFRRSRPAGLTLAGTFLAILGLALLTLTDGLAFHRGDALTLVCAVAFAIHIVILAKMAPRNPVIPFTAVQLLTTAVLALAASALTEGFPLPDRSVLGALLLTGIVVSAGAFLIQVGSQRIIGPSRTAMVLSLEPLFAAVTAAIVLGERLSARGWIGALLILIGIYVVLMFSPAEDADLTVAESMSDAH
jgi:drug/metabolite transporter (DMT)-like permease